MSTSYSNKTRYSRRKCICSVSTSKSFAGQYVRLANIKCFQTIKLGVLWLERKNAPNTMLGRLYSDPISAFFITICHKKADSNIKCFQNSQLGVLWLERENTPNNVLVQLHLDSISQRRAFLATICHKKADSNIKCFQNSQLKVLWL